MEKSMNDHTKQETNLWAVKGRLVRNAIYSDKVGKALFGTLLVSSEVANRFGDMETKKTYVAFRITDPKLVDAVNASPTVEGMMLAIAGRGYLSDERRTTDETTGEVKTYSRQPTIAVDGSAGQYAVNLGNGSEDHSKYETNLWSVKGRLARNAHYSDKHGKALLGTLLVNSEVPNRFGDMETKKTYVEFVISKPEIVDAVNASPTVEGVMLAFSGRGYMSEERRSTDEATGEVKTYSGQPTIVVDGGAGQDAVNLGR